MSERKTNDQGPSFSAPQKTTLVKGGGKKTSKGSGSGLCLFFLGLVALTGLGFIHFLPELLVKAKPVVHSCDLYVVNGEATVWGITQSSFEFIRQEGLAAAFQTLLQFFKAEALKSPPFFSVDQVKGKKLIMLGGGYLIHFLEYVQPFEIEIYMLEDPKYQERIERKQLIKKFIPVENFGQTAITDQEKILSIINSSGIKFDGVFSLSEAQSPLVSKIANRLGLPGNPESASLIARNKFKVRQVMREKNLRTPKIFYINNQEDLKKAGEFVGFPAFLKPNFGVSAMFSVRVNNFQELQKEYEQAISQMIPDQETIYFYGTQMVLEEMIFGAEVQVEFLVYKGEVVFHSFSSEYSPTRDYLVFPVNLTASQQKEMYDLAVGTIKAIGLTDGAVHIEMFWTSSGPHIIEVNNRLSRGFLPTRFTHQLFFGEKLTDYFASVIFIALGVPPPVYQRSTSPLHMAIFLDHPTKTGWETEGGCAAFFASSSSEALREGLLWKNSIKQN